MAPVAPPADQAADLLQKCSLESQTKNSEVPDATKKPSSIKYGSVDGGKANGSIQPFDRSTTPSTQNYMDQNSYYLPNGYPPTYYYEGFDGSNGDYGMEMPPGVYGDNGSLMYDGYSYGYAPYGAYPPAMGHDGQLYGPQHYQYPTPYYQPQNPPSGPYTLNQTPASQREVSTSIAADQTPLSVEMTKENSNNGSGHGNGSVEKGPNYHNGSFGRGLLPGGIPASGYQDPRFGFDGTRYPLPWTDGTTFSGAQAKSAASGNQSLRPPPHLMGLHHPRPSPGMALAPEFVNRLYSNNIRYGPSFNGYDNKYKSRGRGNGFYSFDNENTDGLNELRRGPRDQGFKNQKGFTPVTLAVKGEKLPSNGNTNEDKEKDSLCVIPDKEQYNLEDFPDKYSDAKFFIIKSYSEDDIHKSIKYNVWASTPNGNKKLNSGYHEAQEKSSTCPVFLFFSVNTSGQFVGLAEMEGPVDFSKSVEYWQQDKWNGCFPVKWHIIKDVPNNLLKHITLEYNENKPVTNSRDTQEVKLEQGLQMLKIFKDHTSKTCILDDFAFYESRQKAMQDRRAKQQLQKQVLDEKLTVATGINGKDNEVPNGKQRLEKSLEVPATLVNEQGAIEEVVSEENGSVSGS